MDLKMDYLCNKTQSYFSAAYATVLYFCRFVCMFVSFSLVQDRLG